MYVVYTYMHIINQTASYTPVLKSIVYKKSCVSAHSTTNIWIIKEKPKWWNSACFWNVCFISCFVPDSFSSPEEVLTYQTDGFNLSVLWELRDFLWNHVVFRESSEPSFGTCLHSQFSVFTSWTSDCFYLREILHLSVSWQISLKFRREVSAVCRARRRISCSCMTACESMQTSRNIWPRDAAELQALIALLTWTGHSTHRDGWKLTGRSAEITWEQINLSSTSSESIFNSFSLASRPCRIADVFHITDAFLKKLFLLGTSPW